jgi:hypothetical protein
MPVKPVQLLGGADALAKLGVTIEKIVQGAEAASYQAGERIMTIVKRDHVPVDTGALRSTGRVSFPKRDIDRVTVEMGFGGPAKAGEHGEVGYAVVVHEDLTATHTVGEAKYLEGPARDEITSGRALTQMAQTIKRRAGIK